MALRMILTGEDPFLRKKSRVLTDFNERTAMLMDDLAETLRSANGLGLAAPQVGVLRRAVVGADGEEIMEFINPEITMQEGEIGMEEACLSCPGISGYVKRPQNIEVRANDRLGAEFTRAFEGVLARAVCHEVDHLDGILFTDLAELLLEDSEDDEVEEPAAQAVDVQSEPLQDGGGERADNSEGE